MFDDFWGYFEKHDLLSNNGSGYFLGNVWDTFLNI